MGKNDCVTMADALQIVAIEDLQVSKRRK